MTKIHSPEVSAAILALMMAAELSNNGRAYVYEEVPAEVAEGLESAGLRLNPGRDAFGKPCTVVHTARGWAAYVSEVDAMNRATADRINAEQARKGYAF